MLTFLKWSFQTYCILKVKMKVDSIRIRVVLVLDKIFRPLLQEKHPACPQPKFGPARERMQTCAFI